VYHVQAIIVSIDQYAESALSNRNMGLAVESATTFPSHLSQVV
jgi:hypothetical protein